MWCCHRYAPLTVQALGSLLNIDDIYLRSDWSAGSLLHIDFLYGTQPPFVPLSCTRYHGESDTVSVNNSQIKFQS